MVRLAIVVIALGLAVVARELPSNLPEPGELALHLDEEQFEDYLDKWLAYNQTKVAARSDLRSGCTIRVNGDLGQPQPVYLHNDDYIVPTGNTGLIHLNTGEQVYIACTRTDTTILHPNIAGSVSTAVATLTSGYRADHLKATPLQHLLYNYLYRVATCVNNDLVSGPGWLSGNGAFGGITCSGHAYHEAQATDDKCFNNNLVIRIGFTVDDTFYPLFRSCFDQSRLEVLYVWYEQNAPNAVHQSGVDRPSWLVGSFFPGVGINNRYTQVQQKAVIASLVGDELADKYVTSSQFLARGHLAAKTDFIFATGQRSSFYFINAAPQWQPFNAGNWNWLEQNLRARIGEAGYSTTIYTGTYGVSQLRDQNDQLVDIYLHRDANDNPQLPVPLYFYKVVYDQSRRIGTAFVSINNPYYTAAEARSLQFCTDRCRNNNAFSWLRWQPDRIDIGYSFCCTVEEFRRFVPHLPQFEVTGLLS